ncbi:RCC1 domain-containing protein [Bdellovibrio sp. GT3]|uniref:RCC1 domain-containing protein n=1 Tax=Bdellovibrio sp. GT3 TaxID=3136282 RepID=UPI0030F026F3
MVSLLKSESRASVNFEGEYAVDSKKYITTSTPSISVSLLPPQVSEIAIGEGESCDGLEWQSKKSSYDLVLSPEIGEKKISYRYRINGKDFACQTVSVHLVAASPSPTPTPSPSPTPSPTPGVVTTPNLELSNPVTIPSRIQTPEILASGLNSGDIVSIYSDSACSIFLTSTTAVTTTAKLNVPILGADGTYNFYATRSQGGSVSACSTGLLYNLDSTPPLIQLTSTLPSMIRGGDVVSLSWISSDLNIAPNMVALEYSLDSGITWSSIVLAQPPSGTYNWVSPLISANVKVRATTADLADNVSLTSPANILIDSTPPVVVMSTPAPAVGLSSTSFVWVISYLDASSITLTNNDITLQGANTGCTKKIGGLDRPDSRLLIVENCTGAGTLAPSIAAGTASDAVGNLALNQTGTSVIVDQTIYIVGMPAPTNPLSEGNSTASHSINLQVAPATTSDITIEFVVNKAITTAINPTHFSLANNSMTLPAGVSSASTNFQLYGDTFASSSLVFQLDLTPYSNTANVVASVFNSYNQTVFDDDGTSDKFVKVSSGEAHTCGITQSGILKCWGANYSGQLGIGSTINQSSPAIVDNGISYQMVVASIDHTCAITSSGILKCWGDNTSGQLGNGTNVATNAPVVIDSGVTFSSVAAGYEHTCAITTSGSLKCWGLNDSGQLGNGSMTSLSLPALIDIGFIYSSVTAGGSHTCAIQNSGQLKCWGKNDSGQLGTGGTSSISSPNLVDGSTTYSMVSAFSDYTCGVTTTGSLKCWGYNGAGQLGNNTTTTLMTPTMIDSGTSYITVNTGYDQTCGITTMGYLKCWGSNQNGQLGDGTTIDRKTPGITDNTAYTSVSVGGYHTCGILSAGYLKCWGDNQYGQLGMGYGSIVTTPKPVDSATAHSKASAGQVNTCGITARGIKCWGENYGGQIGDRTTAIKPIPTVVDPGTPYKAIAVNGNSAGNHHTCGITETGLLKCWGSNVYGEIGDGTKTKRTYPVLVDSNTSYSAVANGDLHTCAITTSGDLKCWGYNNTNQLGNGTTTESLTPMFIDVGSTYSAIAAGMKHTCGITTSGALKCWGYNVGSLLGDGTTTTRTTPTLIDSGVSYSNIATDESHSCAITSAGAMKCWGTNTAGKLGDNTTTNRSTPTLIDSGTSYKEVTVGSSHSCGITTAGVLKCWGNNEFGQLGDGTLVGKKVPTIIDNGTTYSTVSAGAYHTCATTSSNQLKCWGFNKNYQLGLTNNLLPRFVP